MKQDSTLQAQLIPAQDQIPKEKFTVVQPDAEPPYQQFGDEPRIDLPGLALAIIPGLLVVLNIQTAKYVEMPILEYLFVVLLVAFGGNYWIIRKYQLYPYLPVSKYDNQLKVASVLALFSIVASAQWGWNNSGTIVVAVIWELTRGNKMGILAYGFLAAIIGSLMLERNYSLTKILELIPGITLGFITSTLYTLRQSSPYSILHEFLLVATVFLPVSFPMQKTVKPDLMQWGVMVLAGIISIPSGLITVRMMQKQRVSISMTVFCSIIMLLTSSYIGPITYFGAGLTLAGVLFILYHAYIANTQTTIIL